MGTGGATAAGIMEKGNLRRRLWVRRVRPGLEDRPPPAESHRLRHQGGKSVPAQKQAV